MPVAVEEFERGADLLHRQLEREAAQIVILAPVGRRFIQFVYDPEESAWQSELEGSGVTRGQLRHVAEDLGEVLSALVEDTEEDVFVQTRSNPPRSTEPAEEPDAARRKFVFARERFDIPSLRRRTWVKRTSKNRVPLTMHWEVNLKLADDDEESPPGGGVAYGTVLLRTASTSAGPFSLFDQRSDIPIDVDRYDVDVLIAFLQRLRSAILNAESGEGEQ